MQARQAGNVAADEDDIGWQDSDSEGFVNEWEVQQTEEEEVYYDLQEQLLPLEGRPLQPQATTPEALDNDGQERLQHPARSSYAAAIESTSQQPVPGYEADAGGSPNGALDLQNELETSSSHSEFSFTSTDELGEDSVPTGAQLQKQPASQSLRRLLCCLNPAGTVQYDPNVTASHTYLGDVEELEGGYGVLQDGTTARLPLLRLEGVVLFPGCQLPLLMSTATERRLLSRALAAPAPLTRLLAVMPGLGPRMLHQHSRICCTAEIRQMCRQGGEDGTVAVLALGRQRAEIVDDRSMAQSQTSVLVRILPEGCQSNVPAAMQGYASIIHPALTAPWDLQLLMSRVRQLLQVVLMPVASFKGSPLELSYWVSHNLPLPTSTRQLLLAANSPAERLRLLHGLLERLDQLGCSRCGNLLATTADLVAMTSEGIAGTFVNSAGYVHEMVTFHKVSNIHLEGSSETAHSWFPGYAWTIAYCGVCGSHLGWRFDATRHDLRPPVFWGLRRPVLSCKTRPDSAAHAGGTDDGEDGDHAARGQHGDGGEGEQQLGGLRWPAILRGNVVIPLRYNMEQ